MMSMNPERIGTGIIIELRFLGHSHISRRPTFLSMQGFRATGSSRAFQGLLSSGIALLEQRLR